MSRLMLATFNLNLLLALDGLLGTRSVTEAARRVRVTPSAMSHSLAELREFEHPTDGFVGPCELVVAVGTR